MPNKNDQKTDPQPGPEQTDSQATAEQHSAELSKVLAKLQEICTKLHDIDSMIREKLPDGSPPFEGPAREAASKFNEIVAGIRLIPTRLPNENAE